MTETTDTTDTLEHFRAVIEQATARRSPLQLRGGGTKAWYGQQRVGDVLDTRAYSGIVAYDPAELVITVRCGTPLADVEAALAEHNQLLPFEPPYFGPGATIGGAVAAGLAGPRRSAVGSVRDFVLGAKLMDGRGHVLSFGGQVMKNVAGYDVSRMLAGSLGTLGLILEVSLKVLPQPFAELTLQFEMNAVDAVRKLNEWGGQPLPITGSAWRSDLLVIRLAGASAAIKAARVKMGGELVDAIHAAKFWHAIREQTDNFFADAGPGQALWRLAVPSTAEPHRLPGKQLIEWGGAQRWWITDADAQIVRSAARQDGGHATLFRYGEPGVGVFTPLPAPVMRIHRNLKSVFDPAGIFNPGRMYPEF
ncbi:glycolate oxidase subunit GlcE [Pandoraea pnomenusa]|uniref:glycolate oxidase subunit GlcE n=1 Tax=Pandoraea pnomenusa TaxID=93220 RepID=UPI0011988CEA|nr:glycolate oxidase subunit GlcE [Pandoraea pnomenusa]QDX23143.1 glycolate oxidase subunit GlcE [Pandoraea pnomenusa]